MALASVLVVDDDQPFREAICRVLRGAGYAAEAAADGAMAIKMVRARAPDVLITDIIMPDGDGIGLINATRQDYPQVRILAISGRLYLGALDLLNLATTLGADAALAKPLRTEELLDRVAELTRAAPEAGSGCRR